MLWTEPLASSDELRRCIRDLVALSTLPAGWQNYDMRQIGGSIVRTWLRLAGVRLLRDSSVMI